MTGMTGWGLFYKTFLHVHKEVLEKRLNLSYLSWNQSPQSKFDCHDQILKKSSTWPTLATRMPMRNRFFIFLADGKR